MLRRIIFKKNSNHGKILQNYQQLSTYDSFNHLLTDGFPQHKKMTIEGISARTRDEKHGKHSFYGNYIFFFFFFFCGFKPLMICTTCTFVKFPTNFMGQSFNSRRKPAIVGSWFGYFQTNLYLEKLLISCIFLECS